MGNKSKKQKEEKVIKLEFDLEKEDLENFQKVSEKTLFDLSEVQKIKQNIVAQRENYIKQRDFYGKILEIGDGIAEIEPFKEQLKTTIERLDEELKKNEEALVFATSQAQKYEDFYNYYFDNYEIKDGKAVVKPQALEYVRIQSKLIPNDWKEYSTK
jgi:hypothetical protein